MQNFDDYKCEKKKKQDKLELAGVLKMISEKKDIDYTPLIEKLLTKEVNLVAIVKAIKDIPAPKDLDVSPVVDAIKGIEIKESIVNIPEQKQDTETHRLLKVLLEELKKEKKPKKDEEKKHLINVIRELSDSVDGMAKGTEIAFSSSVAPDVVGSKNIAGETINPATEDKQDDIITAIDGIELDTSDLAKDLTLTDGSQLTGLVDDLGVPIGESNALWVQQEVGKKFINESNEFEAEEEIWNAILEVDEETDVDVIVSATESTGRLKIYADGILDQIVEAGEFLTDVITINDTLTMVSALTGGNVDGSSLDSSYALTPDPAAAIRGATTDKDENNLYIVDFLRRTLYQWSFGTPGDPTTLSYVGVISLSSLYYSEEVRISDDGKRIYLLSDIYKKIGQITLATPFDISSSDGVITIGPTTISGYAMDVSPDETTIVTVGRTTNEVREYTMSTPGDITTATLNGNSFVAGTELSLITSCKYIENGARLLICSNGDNTVYQYDTATPYSIVGISEAIASYDVSSDDVNPTAIYGGYESMEWSMAGYQFDKVFKYTYPGGAYDGSIFGQVLYLAGSEPLTDAHILNVAGERINPSTEENQTNGDQKTQIVDEDGESINQQNPIPVSEDSIYASDLDLNNSDNGGFSGTVEDYFNSLKTVNTDSSATNPKVVTLRFKRSVQTAAIGFGCDDPTKNFSNIKVEILGSADEIRTSADESSDNTKYNSRVINFEPETANGMRISFNTADEVGLSNLIIYKSQNRISRIQAIKPNGTLTDIGATNNDNLKVSLQEYGDTPAIDAFARQRVSEPFTIFDSKQLHDKQPLFWDEEVGGSATSVHTPANAETKMTVTANAADFVIRQTKQRFNYQPGKSQLAFLTFHSPQSVGVTNRVGLFDGTGTNSLTPNNGIFFETNGGFSWNICKNGSIAESVDQADWNVDKLDGTGKSGINLESTASQIAIIDFEWLGVGRVRVGFVIDGLPYYVHYFNHANNPAFESVYMSTPNLPIRYSIESDGTGGGHFDHICSSVISEGGIEKTGVLRGVDNGSSFITSLSTGVTYGLLGIRLKTLYNDVSVIPEALTAIAGTNDDFRWSLQLNPVFDTALTYSDLLNSSVQVGQGVKANSLSSDGIVTASGYASKSSKQTDAVLNTALRIGTTIAGVQDELVLCITPISNNLSILTSLEFRELL